MKMYVISPRNDQLGIQKNYTKSHMTMRCLDGLLAKFMADNRMINKVHWKQTFQVYFVEGSFAVLTNFVCLYLFA